MENQEQIFDSIENDDRVEEELNYDYHKYKNTGNWFYSKKIIENARNDKQRLTYFIDLFEKHLNENNDSFDNIRSVFYKANYDIDMVYEFEEAVGKFFVDNLKIIDYKPDGYLYSADNKWDFKIVILTTKNIYSFNRYINKDQFGCY